MSVPKGKRNVSSLDVYQNAVKLHVSIADWTMRDFGLKSDIKEIKFTAQIHQLSKQDKETLQELFERNHLITKIELAYPEWIVAQKREIIMKLTSDIMEMIISADKIFPVSAKDFIERDSQIRDAKSLAYRLMVEIQATVNLFKLNVNFAEDLVDAIDKEIALLAGWQKNNKTRYAKFLEDPKKFKGDLEQKAKEAALKRDKEEKARIDLTNRVFNSGEEVSVTSEDPGIQIPSSFSEEVSQELMPTVKAQSKDTLDTFFSNPEFS